MFFALSKILYPLMHPIVWVCVLLLWAIITKNKKRKKRLTILSLVFVMFFGNRFIANSLMLLWESEPTKIEKCDSYTYGVVLSGIANLSQEPRVRIYLNKGSDRLLHAFHLYKAGRIKKIIISGGSGTLLDQEKKEGPLLKALLISFGMPIRDIIMEDQSRNTFENAVQVRKILERKNHTEKVLLITSAFHMRRSCACFLKQNIPHDTFATDFNNEPHSATPDYWLIPSNLAFQKWSILLKEWLGMVSYKVSGKI